MDNHSKSRNQNCNIVNVLNFIYYLGNEDDNPSEMSYEQQKQWAIVEAKEQGLESEMTTKLNAHLSEGPWKYLKKRTSTLVNVSTLINFSMFIFIWLWDSNCCIYLFSVYRFKKAINALIGLEYYFFILGVYLFSFNVSDQELNEYNSKLLNIQVVKSDIVMAKMAITSAISSAIACIGWIGSPFFKYIKK